MEQIEITAEQREYLESLRDEIKREVVGPYGHVRIVDAVQYLIDNHEGEVDVEIAAEGAVGDVDPAATESGDSETETATDAAGAGTEDEASGDAPDADSDGTDTEVSDDTGDLESVDGIGPSRAEDLVTAGYDSVEDVANATPGDLAAIDSISESEAEEIIAGAGGRSDGDNGSDDTGDTDSETDGGSIGGPGPAATGGDAGGMLSSMQQLLQEHDDKWTDASGTGYEVELPDGGTESAPTKDDVRALLFRHYN